MRAQVSLTPTESKKLIAKAVIMMDEVKHALVEGMVVIHPSSSTIFIAEELIGRRPKTSVWIRKNFNSTQQKEKMHDKNRGFLL